jgi:hypothetical protein
MTQPLRRAHRSIWLGLGVILPALLAGGLALRPPQAPEERPTDRITLRLPNGTEMVADSRELWGSAVDAPDPLVYWSGDSAGMPANSHLIGSLERGRHAALPLPESGGYLVLYSLAHGEVVAKAPAPKEIR